MPVTHQIVDYLDRRIPFHIISERCAAGTVYTAPDRVEDPHLHSKTFEVQYIHCGNGHYFIHDRFYPVQPHTLCIIPPATAHIYMSDPEPIALSKTMLAFTPALLKKVFRGLPFDAWLTPPNEPGYRQIRFAERDAARVEQLFLLLHHEYTEKPENYCTAIEGYLRQLYIELERARLRATESLASDHRYHGLIEKCLLFVDAHFREALTLARIASHAGRSACHISHVFREATGLSFTEYLAARRIVEVRRLLKDGDRRKLLAIAQENGFATLSSFNRTFRRCVGMTPSQYRELHANMAGHLASQ